MCATAAAAAAATAGLFGCVGVEEPSVGSARLATARLCFQPQVVDSTTSVRTKHFGSIYLNVSRGRGYRSPGSVRDADASVAAAALRPYAIFAPIFIIIAVENQPNRLTIEMRLQALITQYTEI